jgi:hypothetical protein
MKRVRQIKLLLLFVLLTAALFRHEISLAQTNGTDLKAEAANFSSDAAVGSDAAIEIAFSRAPLTNEKIAVIIDQTDVSSLFTQTENRLVYDAKLLPLPAGESTVKVFLIAPNGDWNELARFPLLVEEEKVEPVSTEEKTTADKPARPAEVTESSEKEESETVEPAAETDKESIFKFIPSLTIGMKSQPFQSNFPAETRPDERAVFNDFTVTGSIKTETRFGIFASDSNFDFAGSSFTPETVQFGTLGREAPDIDLASYLMNIRIGKATFALGHTSFGSNRHLVDSFSSRGLSINIPLNKRFDITAGILNGTSVLGFKNFFGVGKIRHQVQGATLGIEFFPARQNALRLEITGFNGYLQAVNGASEGRVVDAERSRGFGLRLLTSDSSERLKIEAGYALSRFFNPQDATLDPDGNAVPLPPALRSAHYADISYRIFKDVKLSEDRHLNLTAAFKYEYVEPLYKSLGASPSPDRFSHDYALDGSVGEITFQFAAARSRDNLANLPSILKSLIRSNRFSVAFPLSAFFNDGEAASPFLPRIGYSIDRTRNFGESVPTNGGFEIDPATVPDLLNTNQTFSSAWQFPKFSVEYTYSRSFADNRQNGAENADNLGWVHGFTVGVNPLETLNFNAGLSFESQKNFEFGLVNRTKTLNVGASWNVFKGATLTGELSQTLAGDRAQTALNRNVNYSGQFAYNFSVEKGRFKKFGVQAFARFADAYLRSRDAANDLRNVTRTKIMTAGMTFNIF